MTLDYTTVKHSCNAVRRQMQSAFPDLHLYFIPHQENKRKEAFQKEMPLLEEHAAGQYITHYFRHNDTAEKTLLKNKSKFTIMAYKQSSGFLNFFKQEEFLALCFINYDRFKNDSYLKNHALHNAWHALSLYINLKDNKGKDTYNKIGKNLIIPHLNEEQKRHRNLSADIFATSVQVIQNKTDALKNIATQRIQSTITPERGFIAENYPFPVCLDTLAFIFKNNLDSYKKNKNDMITAKEITLDSSKMFDETSIQQWKSFSMPAQKMAWYGHPEETILGAAIYTSENTHAQSIADMIAERMEINPDNLTSFLDYNPFTAIEANERIHKKKCKSLIKNLLLKVSKPIDYKVLISAAEKQNVNICTKHAIGWCVPALIKAAHLIANGQMTNNTQRKEIENIFIEELENIPFTTLDFFSTQIFLRRRKGMNIDQKALQDIAATEEEFLSIYNGLMGIPLFQDSIKNIDFEEETPDKKNIIDFISSETIQE